MHPFHDFHRHWPVYPVCPGASTSPAPWPPSDTETAAKGISHDCRRLEAPHYGGFPPHQHPEKAAGSTTSSGRKVSPLASLMHSGMAPRNPSTFPGAELSWAAMWGCRGRARHCSPPRKQASSHPSPMLPVIPHGWPTGHFTGFLRLSQGAVARWSPSHLPPAHRAGGWAGLAAAPAWAQGI